MARVRHVRSNTTVGAVSAASHGGSAVNLDVLDGEVINFQTLNLGVGFGVGQQDQQKAAGLLGPASRGVLVLLSLCMVALKEGDEKNIRACKREV